MSIYYNASGETREIDDALFAAWVDAGNPKAAQWTRRPDPPAYDPATHSCAWDGAQWVVSELPPPPVPQSVESHKIKIALTALGWRAEVEDLASTSSQSIKDAWTAPYMSRDSVLLNQCAFALGKTSAQVDDLFRLADGTEIECMSAADDAREIPVECDPKADSYAGYR